MYFINTGFFKCTLRIQKLLVLLINANVIYFQVLIFIIINNIINVKFIA